MLQFDQVVNIEFKLYDEGRFFKGFYGKFLFIGMIWAQINFTRIW